MKDVFNVKDIQEADRLAHLSGCAEYDLMMRAAKGIFECVNWHGRIAIVCGKGNNGGDGFALATLLKKAGFDVETFSVDDTFSETSKLYFDECEKLNIKHNIFNDDDFSSFDTIVDCLFGIGFKGELKEKYVDVVESINNSGKRVISIDANSGMDLNNGLASAAVKSDLTISITALKPGYYLNSGKDYVGEIREVDISLNPPGKPYKLLEEEDVKHLFKKRLNLSNKGDFGYVGIMGGSKNYPGAVKLANMGQNAIYSGCGVSKVIVPDIIADKLYPHVLESTVYPMPSEDGYIRFDKEAVDKALNRLKAVSIGMGWGVSQSNIDTLKYILDTKDLTLIIDADGLNCLAHIGIDVLKTTKCSVVLTPHLKEFARLSTNSIEQLMADPIGASERFVREYPVTLLLKGPTTIVADNENTYLIPTGCPGMATAGSGDVLTGILAGIYGYSDLGKTFTCACGAYINGLAGMLASEEYGDVAMTSSDTARAVSKVIAKLSK